MTVLRRVLDNPFEPLVKECCVNLCSLGIEAHLAEKRGRAIDIKGSPIHWINILFATSGDEPCTVQYVIPDTRGIPSINLESIIVKKIPIFGARINVRWKGYDRGTGIIRLLAGDEFIKNSIINSCEVKIEGHPQRESWLIIQKHWMAKLPCKTLSLVALSQWHCYEKIAQHLLATPISQ